MREPVVNEFGYSYDKEEYVKYVNREGKDPTGGEQLKKNIMYNNVSLKQGIQNFLKE
jgi:hypothetical protein